MKRIGLIGLGNIGRFYTRQLLEAGYPLCVYDIDPACVGQAVSQGAVAAENPGQVTRQSDLIILALPGSPAVEAVMEGENGILQQLSEGQLVIDTGTSRPETDRHYARRCKEKGAGLIDSPLTWRKQGQILMIGGSKEQVEQAREVLTCLSYKLKHVGPVGQGQVLKMMNQMLQANMLAAYAEAVEMARMQKMDPRLLKDYLEFEIPEVLFGDDFSGGGHLNLHYKDLGYLLEIAHDSGASVPVSSLVHEIFKTSKLYAEARHADERWLQAGIASYWRRLNDPDYESK